MEKMRAKRSAKTRVSQDALIALGDSFSLEV
jgi:hypothetical protein